MSEINVLLVDDHAVVREGYKRLIELDRSLCVAGEASDSDDAYMIFKSTLIDVVVTDISMPGQSGIELIRRLRRLDSKAKVLVFSMHCSLTFALQAFQAGAKGYITKSSEPDLLVDAIKDVAAGRKSICPQTRELLAVSRIESESSASDRLAPREFEILLQLLEGRTTKEIAEAIHLSPKTVSNYHYVIKDKLGCRSDIELVHFGLRHGLIDLSK